MFKNFWYAVEFSRRRVAGQAEEGQGPRPAAGPLPQDQRQLGRRDVRPVRAPRRGAVRRQDQGRLHRLPVPRLGVRAERRGAEDPRAPGQGHPAQGADRLLPGAGEVHVRLGLHGRPARGGAAADPGLVRHRRHREPTAPSPASSCGSPTTSGSSRTASTSRTRRSCTAASSATRRSPRSPEFEIESSPWHCKVSVGAQPAELQGHLGDAQPATRPRTCRSARRSRSRRPGACPT